MRSEAERAEEAAQEPDTQRYVPCLSEPSYRNAAGVLSPGLPSQALARQPFPFRHLRATSPGRGSLSWQGSPWQRGVVLLRLIEV